MTFSEKNPFPSIGRGIYSFFWLNEKKISCQKISVIIIEGEHAHESLLRNIDRTDRFHPLFAFFLLFEQLLLPGDIAAIALG